MKHKASWIAGLFLAGGVVLFALAVRGKENPEGDLQAQPQATPAAATWTEAATPKSVATPPPSASSVTGDRQDSTQMVTYEDETTTVTSIAENMTREEASKDRPTAPPETKDDLTDPDRVPSYKPEDGNGKGDGGNNGEGGGPSGDNGASSGDNGGGNNGNHESSNGNGGTPSGNDGGGNGSSSNGNGGNGNPTGGNCGDNGTSGGNPGQVYDPVFGWITTGPTRQDVVDSYGDINKQIGTMGGN